MMSNWKEDVLLRKGQQPGKVLKIADIHSECQERRVTLPCRDPSENIPGEGRAGLKPEPVTGRML